MNFQKQDAVLVRGTSIPVASNLPTNQDPQANLTLTEMLVYDYLHQPMFIGSPDSIPYETDIKRHGYLHIHLIRFMKHWCFSRVPNLL